MDRDPHSCSVAHRTARGLVTACGPKATAEARRLRAAVVTASPASDGGPGTPAIVDVIRFSDSGQARYHSDAGPAVFYLANLCAALS
jgi:hypothetical protein